MAPAAKMSFSEIRASVQADKNNSDLLNLAHALESVEAAQLELSTLRFQIVDTAKAIENGAVLGVSKVRELYDRANSLGKRL